MTSPLTPPPFLKRISRLSLGVDTNRDQEARKEGRTTRNFQHPEFYGNPTPFFFSRCNLSRFARIHSAVTSLPFPLPTPSRALPCPCSAPLGPDKTTSVDDTVTVRAGRRKTKHTVPQYVPLVARLERSIEKKKKARSNPHTPSISRRARPYHFVFSRWKHTKTSSARSAFSKLNPPRSGYVLDQFICPYSAAAC